jgi:hypothetical protein
MINQISKKNWINSTKLILLFSLLFPILSISALQYGLSTKREGNEPINNLQIFGERCSGTNFLHSLLWNNLEGVLKNVDEPHWYDYGWKHFPLWLNVPFENNPKNSPLNSYYFNDSDNHLFIVIFRDPYDWVRSIYQRPHHTFSSMQGISFSEFVRIPWAGAEKIDLNPLTDSFFENVLALRTARVFNMLLIKERVKNIYFVRYETVRDHPQDFLKEISEIYDIPISSIFYPVMTYKGDLNNGPFNKSTYFNISQNDLEFINSQLDEAIERSIGYDLIPDAELIDKRN